MSVLPFAPAANTAPRDRVSAAIDRNNTAAPNRPRAQTPSRTDRTERTDRPDARDDASRTERTARPDTPPDFGALMALLALNTARAAQPPRGLEPPGAHMAQLPHPESASPTDVASLPEFQSAATSAMAPVSPRVPAPGAQAPSAQAPSAPMPPGGASNLPDWFTPPQLPALGPRSTPDLSPAVRLAPGTVSNLPEMSPTPSATDRALALLNALGTPNSGATLETTYAPTAAFSALADRAQSSNLGDLLARGDSQAAGVRGALDALLDVAGTTRGRALSEAARPEFANAVSRSAEDVTSAVRTTDALAPAFRSRLERVMDRMRDEFGHDVQVVETVRSTERQEHLFAQGRTRPGPVVTWTLDSAHLSGEAADVIIDGQWNNPQGYARLHAIAAEEGLHTLGMKDPGHLELRGSALPGEIAAQVPGASNLPDYTSGAASAAGVARVAQVASVARVAQVATVARVGGGATLRNLEGTPRESVSTPSITNSATPNGTRASELVASAASARQSGSGDNTSTNDRRDGDSRSTRASALDNLSSMGALSPSATRVLDGGMPRVAAPVGSDAALRAESIAVLREDSPLRPLSSLTMQLDTPDGPEQVRVSLRGGVVETQVNTSNAALADRLRLQTADLQDALGRHGLDTETLKVQQTVRAHDGDAARQAIADRGETLRAAGASGGQQSGFEQGPRERPTARPHAERDPRSPQDDTHQQRRRDDRQEQR